MMKNISEVDKAIEMWAQSVKGDKELAKEGMWKIMYMSERLVERHKHLSELREIRSSLKRELENISQNISTEKEKIQSLSFELERQLKLWKRKD
jgi:phage shock protein A